MEIESQNNKKKLKNLTERNKDDCLLKKAMQIIDKPLTDEFFFCLWRFCCL